MAGRIAASPARAVLETSGGQAPQHLVNEFAAVIADGGSQVTLLVGSEAISTIEHLPARTPSKASPRSRPSVAPVAQPLTAEPPHLYTALYYPERARCQPWCRSLSRHGPVDHPSLPPASFADIALTRVLTGSECEWGKVLACEPPHRIVVAWQITESGGAWVYDPDPSHASEFEATFREQPDGQTRVELEHRHIERHGPGAAGIRSGVSGPGGWPGILENYAKAAAAT